MHQPWRGSLERLRLAGCPNLRPVVQGGMPRNAIIVLDHVAIDSVTASTMKALTGVGFDNRLIVPELALDLFDKDAKTRTIAAFDNTTAGTSATPASAIAANASSSDSVLRPRALINYDKLRQKRNVLLDQTTYRVVVQRVDEYDVKLMKKLQIHPKSCDTRLYVLCALFFRKKFRKPTIIASSDPVVQQMAAEFQLPTCEPVDIVTCGELLGPAPRPQPELLKSPPPPLCSSKAWNTCRY
ncbi:hypothetical protein LSCM1_05966 [Leishmania martiniquensis]|uniref:Uncharacterized protein n=1 Tax=Leishmania martiniquensis TaxID=1580590 RepID=A0A836GZG5_9TRYP|nr:hypothetical protein LSCM1_05966 [Leishmania martiniquensis]